MKALRHSLRHRMMAVVVAAVLATSAVFGLTTFIYAYSLEDQLFSTALKKEIERQQERWKRDRTLPVPELAYIEIYRGTADIPADLAAQMRENSEQVEFYGTQGRHYHIARFSLSDRAGSIGAEGAGADALAVAEVSRYLLVRPYRDAMIRFLVALSLFIAVVMAFFGLVLASRAMRPLKQLADDVSEAGLIVPVVNAKNYPPNEIGILAGALDNAFNRIRSFVDREQAFTRDVSHELRTPLAVIRGATEVIALRRDLPSPIAEALRRIETASIDMASALDLLLALARESEGSVTVPEPVLLYPIVEKAISSAIVRYPANKMDVSISVSANATVFTEKTLLQLIVNNLINNSFQHAPDGTLLVKFDNRILTVDDNGPGLENIAEPFARFAKGRSSEGSGLGLDICRRLSAMAGIELSYKQGTDGRGACFHLEFGENGNSA